MRKLVFASLIFAIIGFPSILFAGACYSDGAGNMHCSDGRFLHGDGSGNLHGSDGTFYHHDGAGNYHGSNGTFMHGDGAGNAFGSGTHPSNQQHGSGQYQYRSVISMEAADTTVVETIGDILPRL